MLEAFGLSDAGSIRPNNEDYFVSDPEAGIFILADGMGGANAGEYASHLSAESLYQTLLAQGAAEADQAKLAAAFAQSNALVRQAARENPELEGMGTTLLAARAVNRTHFDIASVGDSRAYLFSREGQFAPVTEDQTWVAEVGSHLGLSDDALKRHPMRHVLTMAVGTTEDLRIYFRSLELAPGDQLLLCSDGLHGVVSEKIICEALESEKSLPDKCHYLIEAAKAAGGPDNVTAILIRLL